MRQAGQNCRGRPRDNSANERVLFALVASRALAPSSKLAASDWVNNDVHIPGLPATSDDACYRAMDWLYAIRGELEKEIYHQVADLLNLEVDLLFFDTTSTYFELGDADDPVARNWRGEVAGSGEDADDDKSAGFRTHGNTKDSRDDLPQIVIGMAVTRDGIPVRVWCWPGNTSDSALIRQVKADMRDWSLGRVVWVADRGFSPQTTGATCAPGTTTTSSGRGSAPGRDSGRQGEQRAPGRLRRRHPDADPLGGQAQPRPVPAQSAHRRLQ